MGAEENDEQEAVGVGAEDAKEVDEERVFTACQEDVVEDCEDEELGEDDA